MFEADDGVDVSVKDARQEALAALKDSLNSIGELKEDLEKMPMEKLQKKYLQ